MGQTCDLQSSISCATRARERGDVALARQVLERAIATAPADGADDLRAELAVVLTDAWALDSARVRLMECRPAFRDSDPVALFALAKLKWIEKGRTRESRAAFDTALAAARAAGDADRAIAASAFIAEDENMEGDAAGALQRLRAAIAEASAPEHRGVRFHALLVLADVLFRNDARSNALAFAKQALELARELGNFRHQAAALRLVAGIHSLSGAKEQALDAACRCAEAGMKSGDPRAIAQALDTVGQAHLALGDSQRAAVEFERCVAYSREQRDDLMLCISLGGLGDALLARGDCTAARRILEDALGVATRIGDRDTEMKVHGLLARVAEVTEDFAAALAAERNRHRVEAEIRHRQSSQNLDRIRAELHNERQQTEEARAAERKLSDALAQVKRLEQRLSLENQYLREEIVATGGFEDIVGRAQPMKRMLQQIEQVAPTEASVLILGETGAGKELVARAIHARSARRDRPIVTVNCATLPASLVESELFGHEKGAFTGAAQRTIGRFELANGGTIFLDEIGELPLDLQAKLLRVLQEGEFERLGEGVTRRTDVRVIAATNRDLQAGMRDGKFRADLYYRLAVFAIAVPPLRERREDIPLLVAHFAARYQTKVGKRIERIPEETMRRFVAYDWPGNVRELANIVHRAVILSPGDALVLDAMFGMAAPAHGMPSDTMPGAPAEPPRAAAQPASDESMRSAERAHVLRVLEACRWNIKGRGNAADRLGVPPSTLRSRMAKLGISRETRG